VMMDARDAVKATENESLLQVQGGSRGLDPPGVTGAFGSLLARRRPRCARDGRGCSRHDTNDLAIQTWRERGNGRRKSRSRCPKSALYVHALKKRFQIYFFKWP